jgi:hypothetical protein
MNIEFKEGVSNANLHPKIYQAIFESAKVFAFHHLILTVTSTTEKVEKRLADSFHYEGKAFDIRTRRLETTKIVRLVEKLRTVLLPIDRNFQVIMKSDHIHIELDDRSKI